MKIRNPATLPGFAPHIATLAVVGEQHAFSPWLAVTGTLTRAYTSKTEVALSRW
jgi:uncharacterized membrane protein